MVIKYGCLSINSLTRELKAYFIISLLLFQMCSLIIGDSPVKEVRKETFGHSLPQRKLNYRINRGNLKEEHSIIADPNGKEAHYNYTFEFYNLKKIRQKNGYLLKVDGFEYKEDPGMPIVPFKPLLFELPYGARISQLMVWFLKEEKLDISPADIASAPPIYSGSLKITRNLSNINVYPLYKYEVIFNGYFRNHRLLLLNVYPIRYDFKHNSVLVFKKTIIQISYRIIAPSKRITPLEFFETVLKESDVITLAENSKISTAAGLDIEPFTVDPPGIPIDLLIITSQKYINETTRLVSWKKRMGISALVKTIGDIKDTYTGIDLQDKIRNCIKEYYNHHSIKWVLLIGDANELPPRYVYVHDGYLEEGDLVPTDYYYAGLDGTWDSDADGVYGEDPSDIDWYPEVVVGRIPISTSEELSRIIDRIIEYETYMSNETIWKHAILAGAYSNYNADTNGDDLQDRPKTDEAKLNYYIMSDFLIPNGFTYTRLYEAAGLDPTDYAYDLPLNLTNMVLSISRGALIVNMAGHGSPKEIWRKVWTKDPDGDGLADESTSPDGDEHEWYPFLNETEMLNVTSPYYPIIYLSACNTGYFDYIEDSLAEFLLKRIAIGVIASARVSWYQIAWDPDTDGGSYNQGLVYRYWEYFINHSARSPAAALYLAKIDYLSDKGLDPYNSSKKNLISYNYFGDPSILVYLVRDSKTSEWIIQTPTTIENQTVFIKQNIIVNNTLKIINSTLFFNASDFITIQITQYGCLEILNSRLLNLTGSYSIDANAGSTLIIDHSEIRGAKDETQVGMWITTNNVIINNSYIFMSDTAIFIVGVNNITIQNTRFYNNEIGLRAVFCQDLHVINSMFESNSERGARIENSTNVVITNCIFMNNDFYGLNLYNNVNTSVIGTRFYLDQIWILGSLESLATLKVIGCTKEDRPILYMFNMSNILVYQSCTYGQILFAYCENIEIINIANTTLTFYKVNHSVILDASITLSDTAIALWYVNDADIENVNLYSNDYAIRIGWSRDITITNSTISRNKRYGIISYYSEQIEINENIFINNNLGETASMGGDKFVYLEKNVYKTHRLAIGFWTSIGNISNVYIANNQIYPYAEQSEYTWGVSLSVLYNYYVLDIVIKNNTIRDIDQGISLWAYDHIFDAEIYENIIYNSSELGLGVMFNAQEILIHDNHVYRSYFGIYITSSMNEIILRNILENNTYGIYLENCSNIHIYENCFIYNDIQGYDDQSNNWNTTNVGNFWSDYVGEDENEDNIGDTFYAIDDNSIDYYPMIFCNILEDYSPPAITIIEPTNNSIVSKNVITLDYVIEENYLKEIRILLNNSLLNKTRIKKQSINITIPNDGIWMIKICAIDFKNNSASKILYLTCDTTEPQIEILSPLNQSKICTNTVIINWEAMDELSGIAYFALSIDSAEWIVLNALNYTLTNLTDGEHTIIIRAYDIASNFEEKAVIFTVDTTPPTLTIINPSNYTLFNTSNVPIAWVARDKLSGIKYFTLSIDSNPWITIYTPNYTLINLTDGEHTIIIRAYDVAGNFREKRIILVIDTISPDLIIISPSNHTVLDSPNVTITWSASDALSGVAYFLIRLDYGSWINITDNEFTFNGLCEGAHIFAIIVYDNAGNTLKRVLIFSIHHKKPISTIVNMGLILAVISIGIIALVIVIRKKSR